MASPKGAPSLLGRAGGEASSLPIGELSTGNVDNISCDEEAPDSACARLGTQPKQKLLSPRVGCGGRGFYCAVKYPLLPKLTAVVPVALLPRYKPCHAVVASVGAVVEYFR